MCYAEESLLTKRIRCAIIIQLVLECCIVLFSLTTFNDYGYVGLIAGIIALGGTIAALTHGCGNSRRGYKALLLCNGVALPISLVHLGLTAYLIVNIEKICCEREDTDMSSVRALLIALAVLWILGLTVRLMVVYRVHKHMKELSAPASANVNPVRGVPVAVAVTVTNAPAPA